VRNATQSASAAQVIACVQHWVSTQVTHAALTCGSCEPRTGIAPQALDVSTGPASAVPASPPESPPAPVSVAASLPPCELSPAAPESAGVDPALLLEHAAMGASAKRTAMRAPGNRANRIPPLYLKSWYGT
jgi:hypothetical protein